MTRVAGRWVLGCGSAGRELSARRGWIRLGVQTAVFPRTVQARQGVLGWNVGRGGLNTTAVMDETFGLESYTGMYKPAAEESKALLNETGDWESDAYGVDGSAGGADDDDWNDLFMEMDVANDTVSHPLIDQPTSGSFVSSFNRSASAPDLLGMPGAVPNSHLSIFRPANILLRKRRCWIRRRGSTSMVSTSCEFSCPGGAVRDGAEACDEAERACEAKDSARAECIHPVSCQHPAGSAHIRTACQPVCRHGEECFGVYFGRAGSSYHAANSALQSPPEAGPADLQVK